MEKKQILIYAVILIVVGIITFGALYFINIEEKLAVCNEDGSCPNNATCSRDEHCISGYCGQASICADMPPEEEVPKGYILDESCTDQGGRLVDGEECPEGDHDLGKIYDVDCICRCCKEN